MSSIERKYFYHKIVYPAKLSFMGIVKSQEKSREVMRQ
jgi:hypothetical protein